MNKRARYLAGLKAKGRASRNRFAEALAEGESVQEASRQAGVCFARGKVFLKEIRDRLGPQAV